MENTANMLYITFHLLLIENIGAYLFSHICAYVPNFEPNIGISKLIIILKDLGVSKEGREMENKSK